MILLFRALASLAAACVVFVAGMWIWADIAQIAHDWGGKPYLFVANSFVMAGLGVAIGATVSTIAAHRDFVTPSLAGLALLVLGFVGVGLIAGESMDEAAVDRTLIDTFLCWGGYAASVGVVFLAKRRWRLRKDRRVVASVQG